MTPDEDFDFESYRINPGTADRRMPKEKNQIIGCPIWWLQCVLPVVHSKCQLVVAIYLWRRRIVCGGGDTFDVPNKGRNGLAELGISRKAKYRTLELLAAAGLIRIAKRSAKTAPMVTILAKNPEWLPL
jgi:hypothetical protein